MRIPGRPSRTSSSRPNRDPKTDAWRPLIGHSYALGLAWARREARHRFPGSRAALQRLLVPLDPWRFYEMPKVAEQVFTGRWLDVSSPKLIMSMLQAEGRGDWIGIDLFEREIENWRHLDPSLDLRIQDARALEFDDESFDGAICVSVIEHIADDGDGRVMEEIWRVLGPGGELHLTTNVGPVAGVTYIADRRYDDASVAGDDGRVFFERRYTAASIEERLLGRPWEVLERQYVRMRRPWIHSGFARLAPLSYPFGFTLRWLCPSAFEEIPDPRVLAPDEMGVVFLRLRKPAEDTAT